MIKLDSKRIAVIGLGRFGGGIGVTRWLCGQGAEVTIIDAASTEKLTESINKVSDLNVKLKLGTNNPDDIENADIVVASPAIPKEAPILAHARKKGIPITSEINLFFGHCPATIVGITGSVGKSTTTVMAGKIISTKYKTYVGGNIGKSLLNDLKNIKHNDVVVLELSSFQLESLEKLQKSPHLALVTNIQPNHLDRHHTFENYCHAKKNIFRFQNNSDILILNREDPQVASWANQALSKVDFFDSNDEPFELNVAGRHNQLNAQAAWSIAKHLGISRKEAQIALKEFQALPHRLQTVCKKEDDVTFINDSKCTTPSGAIVALEAFPQRSTILIAGGYDKGSDFTELGTTIAERARILIAIGNTRQKIIEATEKSKNDELPLIFSFDNFTEAVEFAKHQAQPSETVLLSPACASYDMFTNYEQRGDEFTKLILKP